MLRRDNQKLCARTITSLAAQSVFGASGARRKLGTGFTPGFVMWRANIPRDVTANRRASTSVCTTHLELNIAGTSRRSSFCSIYSIFWLLLLFDLFIQDGRLSNRTTLCNRPNSALPQLLLPAEATQVSSRCSAAGQQYDQRCDQIRYPGLGTGSNN